MTDLETFGDFTYDPDARTLRGLLVPFGEKSRTASTGQTDIEFSADTLDLPRDPSVVTLNREHDRHDPVGRATVLEKTERGVVAEFQLADTDEADDWLARQRENLRKLSAEVRFAADRTRARLTGAALVTEGAFASAALFALAESVADEDTETPAEETPDADNDAAETADKEEVVTDIATLPEGVASPAGNEGTVDTSASGLFAAIATAERTGDRSALFAIANIQHSGPSTVTIGADVQQPGYVGELWKRQPYEQKFVPLLNQGTLTSFKVDGWRWTTEPVVGDYSGNVSEVPSAAVDTEPVTTTAQRIAGGHKIDRRFQDFGDQGVIESYFRLQTEDVARKIDAKALAAITGAATAKTVSSILYAGSEPYPVGLAGIVDAALGVIATDNLPTFGIVSAELWRDIVLTGKNDVLAYLQAGFGLTSGEMEGFKLLPGAVGTGKVIVGAKPAITFYTQPGVIRVDAVDPHNGSIDPAVYAYWASLTHNAAAIVSVDTATYDDGEA